MPPSTKKNKDRFLLIVESPSKCKKIEDYLGPNYQCISSKGHFREINGLSAIDLKNRFQPTYTLIPEKAYHVAQIRKIIAAYPKHHILIATDDDREGEAIAWHICDEFGLSVDSTPRIVFHEITKPAVVKAVENPTTVNMSLVSAAKARQVLDMIVGFKLSPLLWRNVSSTKTKTKNGTSALSAGRCQTPALRLVHDNDTLCKSATKNMLSRVYGTFFSRNIRFRLSRDFDNTDALLSFLEKSKTFTHTLFIDKTKAASQAAPKPFTTSRLLQQASSQLYLSPKTTMELCQTLYQSGLITYMRTDSAKFSPVFLEKVREYILAGFGDTYIGDLGSLEQKDAANPHEAIRPTNLALKHYQTDNACLSKLYTLIWTTSLQACMSAAKSQKTCVRVSSSLPDVFYEYCVETPLHTGWRKLTENAEKPDVSEGLLFYFQSQNSATSVSWSKIETETAQEGRVSHYTEASLIQKLEELGIGRPSTFASLVATIEERGYVKKTDVKGRAVTCTDYELMPDGVLNTRIFDKVFGEEKGKLVLQPIGSLVLAFLLAHFDAFFSYGYTESMERALDQVAAMPPGEAAESWPNICQQCLTELTERMEPLKAAKKQTFELQDANYELVFSSYGASVKHVLEDGTTEYLSVKPEMVDSLDLEKAKRGEYSVEDLVFANHLGVYEGENVIIKTGKYGAYAQWDKNTQSMKSLDKPLSEITMSDFLTLMEAKSETDPPKDKSTLRTLTPNLSIRKGKYGAYIYHKTDAMEKPAFYPLKAMRTKWQESDTPALIQWIQNTYNI
jgi:DNA topoisomerase-1